MNIFTRNNENDFLKYLTLDEQQLFNNIAQVKTYKKDEIIFQEGDKCRDIFYINSGALVAFKKNKKNDEIVFETLHRGEIVGEINLTFKKRKFSLKAKYISEIVVYPFSKLENLLKNNFDLSIKIFAAVNDIITIKNIKLTQKLSN